MSIDRDLCTGKGCNMKMICNRYYKEALKGYNNKYVYIMEPPFKVDKDGRFECEFFVNIVVNLIESDLKAIDNAKRPKR